MANRAETPRVIITVPSPIKQTMDRTFRIVRCMAYPPILKPMRLVSEEEAVGRNAKELVEDHNHGRKHYGRDGETPQRSYPRRQSSVFAAGTADPRSRSPIRH